MPDRPTPHLRALDPETAAIVRELAEELGRSDREVVSAAVRLLGITYALQRTAGRSAVGWALGGEPRLAA